MPAYSMEEKLRKDKIYQAPLKEEPVLKNNGKETIKLSNYFSSFTAGKVRDWEGNKNTAFIESKRDFKHRSLSNDEKMLNMRRKQALFPGSRNAYANNVNKEKSALFLKERKKHSTARLVEQYKELVEKSDNKALHKSMPFLSKKDEEIEINSIRQRQGAKNQKRINHLREVMTLKDQRALEFKNKLIKAENLKKPAENKRDFDLLVYRKFINPPLLEEKETNSNENRPNTNLKFFNVHL